MSYWLLKSEPDEFSITDLRQKTTAPWDGVRNYQARNFIRDMQPGDLAFFYHSSCKDIGIAGVMKVVSHAYPDPLAVDKNSDYFDTKSQTENTWLAIDMAYQSKFKHVIKLAHIKTLALKDDRLKNLALIQKGNRLSVMPISSEQWECLYAASEPN
ncbi:EVE domain-containing protein [Pseudomonas sp. HK3]|jgi:predicted RNA-binding protein with PUA-like domain